ncbi:MAG TPA: ATP-grasp domain-containing protein [Blastocatellia bacterium]|nr:ATP-grasp domain-containing protein [Blastocatellia bacterium]
MPRVLLLLPTTTYRTKAFIEAGLRTGYEIVAASEAPSTMSGSNPAGLLALPLADPDRAAATVVEFAKENPIDAVIPVDEDTAVVAAVIAQALGLKHNSPESARAAKNKRLMRQVLQEKGVRVPGFWNFSLEAPPSGLASQVTYPCVVKPVSLSTSRGVMRVDDESQFILAVQRLEALLARPDIVRRGGDGNRELLVEKYIPGVEVAVEGLLTDGIPQALAIFDKPDPLVGPFFEETIYVTPSRLPAAVQTAIVEMTQAATSAMGLTKGPIHAELRVNDAGPWVIEVAARAIGGLCSRALRFGSGLSLEELIIRHAVGEDVSPVRREMLAAGVMMIPIPKAGVLKDVRGIDQALQVDGIEDVVITAHVTQEIQPPPEGASYLGFIFSRAGTPERVEAALREAHGRLKFSIG